MAIVTLLYQRDMLCASHLNPQRRKSGEIAGLHQRQYGVTLPPSGMVSTPNEDIVQEAQRIVNTTDERGLTLRLFGVMAIRFHCPSATHRGLQREYADIDLMGSSELSDGLWIVTMITKGHGMVLIDDPLPANAFLVTSWTQKRR